MGEFAVWYTDSARDDLPRLFDFLLARAETLEDFDAAQVTIDTIRLDIEMRLGKAPFIFCKAAQSPFLRELVIPLRGTGCVALYEIERGSTVDVLAVRHQREDDYH